MKKLISVWLSLAILLFSTTSIYAEDNVTGQFLNRNVDINGIQLKNYYLENSFLLYQGVTYFPLNEEMEDILGFAAQMDWESRTLKILKKEPVKTKPDAEILKNNLQNVTAQVLKDITVLTLTEEEAAPHASLEEALPDELYGASFQADLVDIAGQIEEFVVEQEKEWISIPDLISKELDLSKSPALLAGDTIYLPIRAFTGDNNFGWDAYYDDYSGVYVSTKEGVSAASLVDKGESDYNRGLVNYIRSRNGAIPTGMALSMVFVFKHEADINNLDVTLLLAMAEKESTFRSDVVSSGGSVGLMQIMPSTANAFGISRSQLFDMHTNIEFGARYIGSHLQTFGTETKALSAYNQGGGAVSRGNYSTRYATRIQGAQQTMESYLTQNGYGTGN